MEKKIIKVVFDDKLNYTFLNNECLRLGSNGSVEMWFKFETYTNNSTYQLNALLPDKKTTFEVLSDIHEDENGVNWVIWKISGNYTNLKGQILLTLYIYNNDLIFATQTLPIYCMYSVVGDTENVIITPNEYETILYALSNKADLGVDGKVLRTQLPEAYDLGLVQESLEKSNLLSTQANQLALENDRRLSVLEQNGFAVEVVDNLETQSSTKALSAKQGYLLNEKIKAISGVSGGTTNYENLTNKPKINGVELVEDLTFEDLGLRSINDLELASIFGE